MGKTHRFEAEDYSDELEGYDVLRAFPEDDLGLEPGMNEVDDHLFEGGTLEEFDRDVRRRRKKLRGLRREANSDHLRKRSS